MLYAIDTPEKMDWFLEGLENREILPSGNDLTEEGRAEIIRAIAEHRAARRAVLETPRQVAYA